MHSSFLLPFFICSSFVNRPINVDNVKILRYNIDTVKIGGAVMEKRPYHHKNLKNDLIEKGIELVNDVLVKGNCNTSAQLFVEEANLERGRVVIKGVGPNLVIPAISILSYGAIKLRSGVETI